MILGYISLYEPSAIPSRLDFLDPRCRVLCAFLGALSIASLKSPAARAAGSALPLFLLCLDRRAGFERLARQIADVNKVSAFILVFLPLTYPGERALWVFSINGARMAFIVVWKLNLISVLLIRLAASMGMAGVNEALTGLRFSLKMRMLLLLTMRYIFLLADRVSSTWRAVGLRSRDISGLDACRAFAYMLGTTLVHSSDRAERSSLALACRGGMSGFSQTSRRRWTWRESLFCALFLLNSCCLWAVAMSF